MTGQISLLFCFESRHNLIKLQDTKDTIKRITTHDIGYTKILQLFNPLGKLAGMAIYFADVFSLF